MRAVYAFVRDCLRDDVKLIKFILCACPSSTPENPPTNSCRAMHAASNPLPRDLKVSDPDVRDLTLTELGLAPPPCFSDSSMTR